MAIQVEVWGDYALFSRPEFKVEHVSYDTMTPSAARGLLESIYWHPGLRWRIDRIHVCSPIRFTNIRRNEVKDTISARKVKTVMEKGQGELYLATPESFRTSSSVAWNGASATVCPISAQGSFRPIFAAARSCRPVRRSWRVSVIWAGSCWIWTTPIPGTSRPGSSGPV